MKKRLAIVMLLIVVLSLSGCGNSTSEEVNSEVSSNTATPSPENAGVTESTVETTTTPEPTEEPIKELVPIEETLIIPEGVVNMHYNPLEEQEYSSLDKVEIYYTYEEDIPYYIGREHEESINFIKNNKESEEDELLYLGTTRHLPSIIHQSTSYVEIDDPSMAKIEGDELVPLKEGTFNLNCYNYKMDLLETKRFVCSTFNDSKGMKESYRTIQGSLGSFWNEYDINYWKQSVHTIMDMSYMLQSRDFCYNFQKEHKFLVIENQSNAIDRWVWTGDAQTIFDMSGGVCIQVAQLATYMLADDYEDWGVVLVEGNQGHIFNWFYEDGNYYVFDFTQVISDNNSKISNSYRDYSHEVRTFSSVDQIKNWCKKEKVDLDMNYCIYMYSCKGHDYIACNVNTGMGDSNACLYAEGEYSEITIGFQDVVMDDLIVLWENPNSCKINWRSFSIEEMNPDIEGGIYNYKRETHYYFDY